MRTKKKNVNNSQKQDNGISVIGTRTPNSRIAHRPVPDVPETGNSKASKGMAKAGSQAKKKNTPQATENKVTKEINAYRLTKKIKASAGPQPAENEDMREIKASVGPQHLAKEFVQQPAEKEVVKEPQEQVEASAGHVVEEDSPQEPPPPFV
eukprot:2476851-Ditylum_brightwellii.AAC.1